MKRKNSKQGWFKIFCFTLFFLPALLMGVNVKAQQCTIHTTYNNSSCAVYLEYVIVCPNGNQTQTATVSAGSNHDVVAGCDCFVDYINIYDCNWSTPPKITIYPFNCTSLNTVDFPCCSYDRKFCFDGDPSESTIADK